ncbi:MULTISPECIES: spore-associated protein A [unclassified Streptomyces]|uniref:spore-associated protein A n=1 Tax=unclassified Streptomyces TaxID=2593676 RepID=UPI00225197BB|nr:MULTISPECIES: spore-associated protein A [unclassified Streptomyces]MCX5048639.1 spore-associated protein A [Streptomyces sp. NBC_00474]MCX5056619.1 spore-associated protein A [Streptomyces sp. NBC_00452]MCX5246460.1 spore-associated protein A [Streptomyces sp. NBC_00201]MCX5287721.1 spore-associated protein A [Streptomyces sp. NBC_00183]
MFSSKRLGSAVAVLGLTAAATVAATGTASAASYNGGCGSGYSVIGSKDVGDGKAYITYNGSTGYNCVVTVSDTPGTAMYLDARLRIHRTDVVWKSTEMDAGHFQYYAGPVYVYAKGSCIDYGGSAGNSSYIQIDYNVHCG